MRLGNEFRSEYESCYLAYVKDHNKTIEYWDWLVKEKDCKLMYYISNMDDSGRDEQIGWTTDKKEIKKLWKELKADESTYDMHLYKCIVWESPEYEDEQELIDDEVIDSYWVEE